MSEDPERIVYAPLELIFVIDLESSSGHNRRVPGRDIDSTTGDIIGIGAAWMFFDYSKKEVVVLEKMRFPLYRPCGDEPKPTDPKALREWDFTIFSDDCWTNFWNKPDELDEDGNIIRRYGKSILPKLIDTKMNERSRVEGEKQAIGAILEHAEYWKNHAKENGLKYRLVSDCSSFDFGNIDAMILEHFPDTRGTLHVGGWNGAARSVTTKEETILGLVDNHWYRRHKVSGVENTDNTVRLHHLFDVPPSKFTHTHLPDEDAVSIGWRYLTARAIENGVYTLKEDRVEAPPAGSCKRLYPFMSPDNKRAKTSV